MLLVVRLCLGLGHALVVVVGRCEKEVFALQTERFRHHGWVKDNRQDSLVVGHARLCACRNEPLLREFRLELIGCVVVVNTVGKPYALEVFFEVDELSGSLVAFVLCVECFEGTADTQVVAAVLVEEDITAVQGCFGEVINEGLLLETQ